MRSIGVVLRKLVYEELVMRHARLLRYVQQSGTWGGGDGVAWHLQYWRRLVFLVQAARHSEAMKGWLDFLEESSLRQTVVAANTCILEQIVRCWFYYKSTVRERIAIIQYTIGHLEKIFQKEALLAIYTQQGIKVWQGESKQGPLTMVLHFDRTHRKEGLFSFSLYVGERRLYLLTMWLAPATNGEMALWIGALQGGHGEQQAIRDVTKALFGYRPKNLMVYAARQLAKELSCTAIYAVSNYGFQASHHISAKRRLKTSLDSFWQECEGQPTADRRFYVLPVEEKRKTIEEVESHKRNLYRKRFALLDGMSARMNSVLLPVEKQ